MVKVKDNDGHNLLHSKWASEATLGDTGDFSLTSGSDVLYETYATVAGEELLFYDATSPCGTDHRLVQTGDVLNDDNLKDFLTNLSVIQCQYLVCNPPVGPNVSKAVFLNKGCTPPFNASWHGKPSYYFAQNKFGINIGMYSSKHLVRFTNVPYVSLLPAPQPFPTCVCRLRPNGTRAPVRHHRARRIGRPG